MYFAYIWSIYMKKINKKFHSCTTLIYEVYALENHKIEKRNSLMITFCQWFQNYKRKISIFLNDDYIKKNNTQTYN